MKTSSNSNKSILVDINDKDYTKICSFSGSEHKEGNKGCEIECNISEEKYNKLIDHIEDENISSIDIDTFTVDNISESIQLIYKIIKELYNEYNVYSLKELIESISKLIDKKHGKNIIKEQKKQGANNLIGLILLLYIVMISEF